MKKNNLIKKVILVILATSLLMYIMTGRSYADDVINLDSFESIGSGSTTQPTNNIVTNEVTTTMQESNNTLTNPTNNIVSNTAGTNSSLSNKAAMPDAGSNTELVFIIGISVLAGTAIYLNKKSKI